MTRRAALAGAHKPFEEHPDSVLPDDDTVREEESTPLDHTTNEGVEDASPPAPEAETTFHPPDGARADACAAPHAVDSQALRAKNFRMAAPAPRTPIAISLKNFAKNAAPSASSPSFFAATPPTRAARP